MPTTDNNLALLPDADPARLAERLLHFANGSGGTIVVGYDDKGRELQHIAPDELEGALREAVALTYPLVPASIETTDDLQDGPSHMIVVPRSRQRHTLASTITQGRAVPVVPVSFEDGVVPGATLDDLDAEVVDEFIAKREARSRRKQSDDRVAVLREIGALTPEGSPTVAGLLLFGKNPSMFVKSSGVVFVKFPGIDMRAEGGEMGYGRREEINGPLARVVERTWAVVFEEMRVGAVVKGKDREDVLEYPELAVREALVNAICHRDYAVQGRRIEIRKFSDRLEVISPGGLAGHVTLDNILEEHFSRNPAIVRGLFQWGYIEELGLGVDRMMEEMQRAGHPAPKLEDKKHSFQVTLSNYHDSRRAQQQITPAQALAPNVVMPAGTTINERQARALQFVRDHGRVTNGDYQTLCPNVSSETLRADLADLTSKGLLMKVGEKKGTYYIAK